MYFQNPINYLRWSFLLKVVAASSRSLWQGSEYASKWGKENILPSVRNYLQIRNYYFSMLFGLFRASKNPFIALCETHNALQLPVFFFFFSFFCQLYPEYRGIWSKNYFTDHLTADTIQLFVPVKRKFFGSILFQDKS